MEVIGNRFRENGFPLIIDTCIIPNDTTTNFVCSGMQQVKDRFSSPDCSKYGSIQSCIRTNDLELIGDGSHLTYFEMIGNFSFGGNDYHKSVLMWHNIIKDLGIKVDYITYHPEREDHKKLWLDLGYTMKPDLGCEWSDGNIGGKCCEMFVGDLEIGNLVNTLDHSVDVGFGLERLLQVVEGKKRVDETSVFRQDLSPVVRDHYRALQYLKGNGVFPSYSGRGWIVRLLLRNILKYPEDCKKLIEFSDWIQTEKENSEKKLINGRRLWKRHKDKSLEWWQNTFGLTTDEVEMIRRENEGGHYV